MIESLDVEFPESLRARIEQEFAEVKSAHVAGAERERDKLVAQHILTPDQANSIFSQTRKDFEEMDFEGRVQNVLNNFFFWWPGGWYRDLKIKELKGREERRADIEKSEQLVRDLDEAIQQLGFGDIAERITQRDATLDPQLKMRALVSVYFAMRDKGYERRPLIT